jgi:sigma-B regulation protein RsbQ
MDVLKRNNVTVLGAGKQTMVFVHGFGCNQQMWRLMVPTFAAEYRVVLLDLVGAGHSDLTAYNPAHYSSLDAHAEDVLAVLHALDLHDVVLVGHSVGAMISLLAAIEEPDRVAQLILVAPSPRYLNDVGYIGGFEPADIEELLEEMSNNYLGWSGNFTPVIMGHADRPELAAELNNSFCSTNPAIAQHFARVTFLGDNRADLPLVHIPSLIVQCAHDVIAPLAVGAYMHQHLPDSTLVVLDTSGHCPHLSVPQATSAAMQEFLRFTPTRQL